MIITDFTTVNTYKGLSKNLDIALEYLKNVDMDSLQDGKTLIAGEDVYSIVSTYATREHQESQYEIHKKYMDIQCMIAGEEMICCSDKSTLEVINEYNEMTDKQNLKGDFDEVILYLNPNKVVIFYPQDAHKACCKIGEIKTVRKLLVKVKIE